MLAKTFRVKTDIWIKVHNFELGCRCFEKNKDLISTYNFVEIYVTDNATFKITRWHYIISVAEIAFDIYILWVNHRSISWSGISERHNLPADKNVLYCPICVKFGKSYLSTVILSNCEFHETLHRDGSAYLTGINEITFMHLL